MVSALDNRLLEAIEREHVAEVKAALRDGANANAGTELDSTALHRAAIACSAIMVYHLLKKDAKIDVQNVYDSSPLHRVADRLGDDAAELLVWAGGYAHLNDPDGNGKVPRELAQESALKRQKWSQELVRAERILECFKRFSVAPKVKDWSQISKSELIMPSGVNKYALLDYPETWQHFDEITAALVKAGTPLTKQDLMRPNTENEPFIVNGCKAIKWNAVCDYLQSQGESFSADDFVDEKGESTPLLNFFRDHMSLEEVFQQDVWTGEKPASIRRVYDVLEEPEQADISNLHTLLASARSHSPRAAQQR